MDRYRSYGAVDDSPVSVGDGSFTGVDEYNASENIRPGNVQKAVNHDFSSQDAQTRGGFVCLPELGSSPFGLGASWVSETTPVNKQWSALAVGPNRIVALQPDGTGVDDIMTSVDGCVWQKASSNLPLYWSSITYGGGLFVAMASNAQLYLFDTSFGSTVVSSTGDDIGYDLGYRSMTSYDGLTWTAQTVPGPYSWSGITYGGGQFAVVANGDGGTTQVMTSTDGFTWTLRNTPATQPNHNWRSVTYGGGKYVAVASGGTGSNNRAMYSSDGVTWLATSTPTDPSGCVSVAYGNGVFAAVATTSTSGTLGAMSSPDGIVWTARTTANDDWTSITFGNATFTAVGNSGVAANSVMISTDAETWTKRDAANGNAWSAVAYGIGLYVAVSTNGSPNQVMTATPANSVWATGLFSDPSTPSDIWIMVLGSETVGFYANGKTSRTISLGGETVIRQSTIVQANNQVYIFRGEDSTPLYWNGEWDTSFVPVPNTTLPASFNSIPNSNQATYYQNRLWVVNGKDNIAASDILAFTDYDPLANEISTNTGNSDYVVETFPFGQNSLVVFKNKSIILLQNVEGSLSDVTATEITRQVGLVGINAVTTVGPDLAYVSYGNVNMLTLTSTNNSTQHKTLPLSSRVRKIMSRVNWPYGYKISMGYWSNKLYIALPLDNSTVCNAVVVYNFTTDQWYGEWNFAPEMSMAIQSWQVIDYLGLQRLHAITEDGRIFVTDEGQNDISGSIVAEISTELVTRAYDTSNLNHFQRRLYLDLATNRARFSASSYSEGANEESVVLTDQTYSRAESWKFNDTPYDLTNANNDYNRPYRKDYATGPIGVQSGTGFEPEMVQEFRLPLITRRQGRLSWMKVTNTQGFISVMSLGFETRPGQRANLVQI
jgi:hypothetical protein